MGVGRGSAVARAAGLSEPAFRRPHRVGLGDDLLELPGYAVGADQARSRVCPREDDRSGVEHDDGKRVEGDGARPEHRAGRGVEDQLEAVRRWSGELERARPRQASHVVRNASGAEVKPSSVSRGSRRGRSCGCHSGATDIRATSLPIPITAARSAATPIRSCVVTRSATEIQRVGGAFGPRKRRSTRSMAHASGRDRARSSSNTRTKLSSKPTGADQAAWPFPHARGRAWGVERS